MDREGKLAAQDYVTFNLRMPEELKKSLEKEAEINDRSLNSELVARLKSGLDKRAANRRHRAEEPGVEYAEPLSDAERQVLAVFKKLPAEKQLALISLFK